MLRTAVLALALLGGTFPGSYALQSGSATIASTLQVTPLGGGRARFEIVQRRGASVVRAYAADRTQYMHLIVISDTFSSFAHLHPRLLPDGRFVVEAAVPRSPYRVYADSQPAGGAQQVFRFDVGANATFVRVVPSGPIANAGPYTVRLGTTTLHVGRDEAIAVTILSGGRPARDLRPYLGEAAHAVFVETSDYSYAHVHPMLAGGAMAQMGGGPHAGPHLMLHARLRERGTYKVWLEFRGAGGLYTAPFVVTAV